MPKIPAKRICLIRISALGDTVHALALANGLRKGYPDAHLTWILQPLPYEMVKYQPIIDKFIVLNQNTGIKSWIDLKNRLKEEKFDLVIIPQVSLRVNLITAITNGTIKLGFDFKRSREANFLFTNRKIKSRNPQHVQDQFFEFLDYLEIKYYPATWDFVFTEEEKNWQKSFFEKINHPVISFVISSSDKRKNWNPHGYSHVMNHISKKFDIKPLIVGGPGEHESKISNQIISQCECSPIVALEKPIRKTLLQLAGSIMVVSPDTGPLHAAVALNIPTIGLYGASNPRRCGPYKKFGDLLIDKYTDPGEENDPISRRLKPSRMEQITPDEVIEKIKYGLEKYKLFG